MDRNLEGNLYLECYSTAAVVSAERAAYWSTVISDTYFPLHLSYRDEADFSGHLARRILGPVSLSRLRTKAAQYERFARQIRSGEAGHYLVTVPCSSIVQFYQLGRTITCGPGGFLLERGDEPYRFSYDTANDLFVIKVAREALAERVYQPDRFCTAVFDGRDGLGGLFVETVRRAHTIPDDPAAGEILGRQLIELLALALDRQADCATPPLSVIRAAHLLRAKKIIRRNLSNSELSPEMVATACGISKRYLHELFNESGSTVTQYIRACRLYAARDMLQMPGNQQLSTIAYHLGFCDQAQFSRQFRDFFGQTPRTYRGKLHHCGKGN